MYAHAHQVLRLVSGIYRYYSQQSDLRDLSYTLALINYSFSPKFSHTTDHQI